MEVTRSIPANKATGKLYAEVGYAYSFDRSSLSLYIYVCAHKVSIKLLQYYSMVNNARYHIRNSAHPQGGRLPIAHVMYTAHPAGSMLSP